MTVQEFCSFSFMKETRLDELRDMKFIVQMLSNNDNQLSNR